MEAGHLPGAYLAPHTDRLREELEARWLADVVGRLLPAGRDARVLDLGCGAGLGPLLPAGGIGEYVGVDFRRPDFALPGRHVLHDLRDGLGPVGDEPFDLYVAGFGLASHLSPPAAAAAARAGRRHTPAPVRRWPSRRWACCRWNGRGCGPRRPAPARSLAYALDHDVQVHPWAADELRGQMALAGITTERVLDRSLQAGPKIGEGRYWPGLPPLRGALNDLLEGREATAPLTAALPPLPAGRAAAVHQRLATRRRELVEAHTGTPAELAHAVWALERGSGGGFGHGLLAVGRVA